MTANSFDWDEELPPETEEEVYRGLLRALRRKQGFGLFFVQCSRAQGEKIVVDLRRDLPQQSIQTLRLPGEVATLYDQVADLWQKQPFDVLVVEGLEASLYAYEDTKRFSGWSSEEIYNYSWKGVPKILNHLNQQRDRFRDDFPARFVFLMPPFVVDYFIQRAADFLDWRSGLFQFPRDPHEVIKEADRLVTIGNYNEYLTLAPQERIETILELKSLQETCPDSKRRVQLLFKLGLLFAAEQDYENAIASWDKAIVIKPDYHEAWYNCGNALSDLGRYEEAIDKYDQALQFKPDLPQAWNSRGFVLSALRCYEEAIDKYDQALQFKSDYHEAWYNRGNALSDLGRYEEAIASYDQALCFKPDLHEAWYNLGVALSNLGRYEEAIASYDQALRFKPDLPQAWNNQGVALSDLGRYEEAIDKYDQALHFKPNLHEAWYGRGVVLHNLGLYKEAIASYDRALQIKPDKHEAWYNRGIVLSSLGCYRDALASYDQAIEFKPDHANAYYNKACCYGLQGEIDLAIAALQTAIDLDSEYRDLAKTDTDFDQIRADAVFQALIST